LRVGDGGDLN